MKTIHHDELFANLSAFLKAKGVELTDGSYTQRVRQGCGLLADVINTTQKTVHRARAQADRKLDQLRQVIHEKTAPRSPFRPAPGPTAAESPPPPAATAAPPHRPKRKTRRSGRSLARPRKPSPARAAGAKRKR